MSEAAIKRRMNRAIRAAGKVLNYPDGIAQVTILRNHAFHLEAVRKKEIRKIRIVLDHISPLDIRLVSEISLPENCTKEIWCRALNGKFEVKVL